MRAALVHALRDHLDRPGTWPILEAAARSPEPIEAAAVARLKAEPLPERDAARLAALLAVPLAHAEPDVRQAVLRRCVQRPLRDPRRALLDGTVRSLRTGTPTERDLAAAALVATYGPHDQEAIRIAVEQVLPDRPALHALAVGAEGAWRLSQASARSGYRVFAALPRRLRRHTRNRPLGGLIAWGQWLPDELVRAPRTMLDAPAGRGGPGSTRRGRSRTASCSSPPGAATPHPRSSPRRTCGSRRRRRRGARSPTCPSRGSATHQKERYWR